MDQYYTPRSPCEPPNSSSAPYSWNSWNTTTIFPYLDRHPEFEDFCPQGTTLAALACPFGKLPQQTCRYPSARGFHGCASEQFSCMREVVEHLLTAHADSSLCCRNCFAFFNTPRELTRHLGVGDSCQRSDSPLRVRIPPRAITLVCQFLRQYNWTGPESCWFALFRLLFPGVQLPDSAYIVSNKYASVRTLCEKTLGSGDRPPAQVLNLIWARLDCEDARIGPPVKHQRQYLLSGPLYSRGVNSRAIRFKGWYKDKQLRIYRAVLFSLGSIFDDILQEHTLCVGERALDTNRPRSLDSSVSGEDFVSRSTRVSEAVDRATNVFHGDQASNTKGSPANGGQKSPDPTASTSSAGVKRKHPKPSKTPNDGDLDHSSQDERPKKDHRGKKRSEHGQTEKLEFKCPFSILPLFNCQNFCKKRGWTFSELCDRHLLGDSEGAHGNSGDLDEDQMNDLRTLKKQRVKSTLFPNEKSLHHSKWKEIVLIIRPNLPHHEIGDPVWYKGCYQLAINLDVPEGPVSPLDIDGSFLPYDEMSQQLRDTRQHNSQLLFLLNTQNAQLNQFRQIIMQQSYQLSTMMPRQGHHPLPTEQMPQARALSSRFSIAPDNLSGNGLEILPSHFRSSLTSSNQQSASFQHPVHNPLPHGMDMGLPAIGSGSPGVNSADISPQAHHWAFPNSGFQTLNASDQANWQTSANSMDDSTSSSSFRDSAIGSSSAPGGAFDTRNASKCSCGVGKHPVSERCARCESIIEHEYETFIRENNGNAPPSAPP